METGFSFLTSYTPPRAPLQGLFLWSTPYDLPHNLRQQILLDTHDLETEYQCIIVIDDLFPDHSGIMIHHIYRLKWKNHLLSNSVHNWVSFLSYGSGKRFRSPCYWTFDDYAITWATELRKVHPDIAEDLDYVFAKWHRAAGSGFGMNVKEVATRVRSNAEELYGKGLPWQTLSGFKISGTDILSCFGAPISACSLRAHHSNGPNFFKASHQA